MTQFKTIGELIEATEALRQENFRLALEFSHE